MKFSPVNPGSLITSFKSLQKRNLDRLTMDSIVEPSAAFKIEHKLNYSHCFTEKVEITQDSDNRASLIQGWRNKQGNGYSKAIQAHPHASSKEPD